MQSNSNAPQGACAVLVSIHQPRAAIWDMFDKVCRRNIAGLFSGLEHCTVLVSRNQAGAAV
eukprot:scaffold70854_cov19-Tisochrysis_lutea.AAC.2